MIETIAYFLVSFAAFTSLLPVLVAAWRWSSLRGVRLTLAILVVITLCVEMVTLYYGTVLQRPNLAIFHVFTIVEFWLLLSLYRQSWRNKYAYLWQWLFFGPLLVLAYGDAFVWGGLDHFNVYARLYENIVLVLLAGAYFYTGFRREDEAEYFSGPLASSSLFWISTAVLLYFSASFFVVLFSAAWIDRNAYGFAIFSAHALLVIVKNGLFALALWIKPTSSKSPVSSH